MSERSKTCIDIAVDHRLMNLVAATQFYPTSNTGKHCDLLVQLGRKIRLAGQRPSPEEIGFALWLSQPASIGGIVVVLQQPADNHPYHLGREVTFLNCLTLVALDECFKVASCGMLNLDCVTVIDSLPYIRKKDESTPNLRWKVREAVPAILYAKRPAAVLCMWQAKEDVPLSLAKFKSLGVGKTFSKPFVRFGSVHLTKRINAFHPSYALYHRPYESAFRQLLLLEVTRTCGELCGDWREEEWMQQLRQRCQGKAKQQKPHVSYHLNSSLNAISLLLMELPSRMTDSGSDVYHLLRDRQISEHCCDASLCLQDVDATYGAIHPDDRDNELVMLATQAVDACRDFLAETLIAIKGRKLLLINSVAQGNGYYTNESVRSVTNTAFAAQVNGRQIVQDVRLFLQNFNSSFTVSRDRSRLSVPLSELSHLLLLLAVAFEAEQARLLSTTHHLTTTSAAQSLAAHFSRISLGI